MVTKFIDENTLKHKHQFFFHNSITFVQLKRTIVGNADVEFKTLLLTVLNVRPYRFTTNLKKKKAS